MFQTAFFFSREIERPDKLFFNLSEQIRQFDVMPNIQALPPGIHSDSIPVITFKSANSVFRCEIASGRLDFKVDLGQNFNRYKYSEIYQTYIEISKEIANYIFGLPTLSIQRVGVVGSYFSPAENPIEAVQKINKLPLEDDLSELSIRKNKLQTIGNKICNKIVSYEIIEYVHNGVSTKGVLVNQDINNVPQPEIILNEQEIDVLLDKSFILLSEDSFRDISSWEE
ncbi:hypothetical protein [Shewanella sp. 0m-4]